MLRDFKTYEEQIEILESRGMIVPNKEEAIQFLERNSYYNVINAYKDIFLDKMVPVEKFKNGVTFDNVRALWSFDKYLRNELFRYIIIVERNIKSKLAHFISKRYGTNNYLDINNFDSKHKDAAKNLAEAIISEEKKQISKNNEMIKHYENKYNFIPFWVLVNILSFGQISKFYEYINNSFQSEVAKDISRQLNRTLFPDEIIRSLKTINLIRNLCAHDQRVFDLEQSKKEISPRICQRDSVKNRLSQQLAKIKVYRREMIFRHCFAVL